MARAAVKKTQDVYIPARTIPGTITNVTLELSLEEATALRDILSKVGGLPGTSRRGYAQQVFNALHSSIGYPGAGERLDVRGSISFDPIAGLNLGPDGKPKSPVEY